MGARFAFRTFGVLAPLGVGCRFVLAGGFQNQFKNGMVLTVLFLHTAASVAELLVAATSAAAAASWQSMWLPLVGQATKGGSGMQEKHSKKPSPFFLMVLKTPRQHKTAANPQRRQDPESPEGEPGGQAMKGGRERRNYYPGSGWGCRDDNQVDLCRIFC